MTESAHKYNTVGGGKGLITNFSGIFGDAFDSTVTEDGERIGAGKMEIAGIQMVINPDNDAYEVEIPEAKAVYMHMLGHDCHSIVAGAGHADAIIANLKGYLDRGFQIFLSAHYGPDQTGRPDQDRLPRDAQGGRLRMLLRRRVQGRCQREMPRILRSQLSRHDRRILLPRPVTAA